MKNKITKITAAVISLLMATSAVGCGNNNEYEDIEAPIISGPSDRSVVVYKGDTVSFRSFVKATDNSGNCELTFDASKVNVDKEGRYEVKYTATDEAGNSSNYTLYVSVKSRTYTKENLMSLVESVASRKLGYTKNTAGNKTREAIVRDIHRYVNSAVDFVDSMSNTPSQKSQNGKKTRSGWKTDYIEEAYRTLNGSMRGDCYTFFAVTKAFYEYFGFENVGIQRSDDSELDGTHYWNAVNIGTASSPKWYYCDSTPYRGNFEDGSKNACLMTEKSLLSYVTSKGEKNCYYVIEKRDAAFFEAEDNGGKFPTIQTNKIG